MFFYEFLPFKIITSVFLVLLCIPLYKLSLHISVFLFHKKRIASAICGLDVPFSCDNFSSRPKGMNSFVLFVENKIDPLIVKNRVNRVLKENSAVFEKLLNLYPGEYGGYPFWHFCREGFRVENHITITNMDKFFDENHLNKYICTWTAQGMTAGHPLWEILIIPSFRFQNQNEVHGLLCFKCHHVLGDGYSMFNFLQNIFDEKKESMNKREQTEIYVPKNWVDDFIYIKQTIQYIIFSPFALYVFIINFFMNISGADSIMTQRKKHTNCFSTRQCFDFHTLRKISVTDENKVLRTPPLITLIPCLVFESLKNVLESEGLILKEKFTYVIPALPILHTRQKFWHPASTKFCNYWTYGLLKIPFDADDAIQDKLKATMKYYEFTIDYLKLPCLFASWIFHALLNCIPCFILRWFTNELVMNAPTGATNMAGPKSPVYIGGSKVTNIYAHVGLLYKHAAMTIGIFSYQGKVSVTIVINEEILQGKKLDVHKFWNTFENLMTKLCNK